MKQLILNYVKNNHSEYVIKLIILIMLLLLAVNAFATDVTTPTQEPVSKIEQVAPRVVPDQQVCADTKEWRCKSTGEKVAIVIVTPIVIPFVIVIEAGKIFFGVFGSGSGDVVRAIAGGK